MNNYLIIGIKGFIGKQLASFLSERGLSVYEPMLWWIMRLVIATFLSMCLTPISMTFLKISPLMSASTARERRLYRTP